MNLRGDLYDIIAKLEEKNSALESELTRTIGYLRDYCLIRDREASSLMEDIESLRSQLSIAEKNFEKLSKQGG